MAAPFARSPVATSPSTKAPSAETARRVAVPMAAGFLPRAPSRSSAALSAETVRRATALPTVAGFLPLVMSRSPAAPSAETARRASPAAAAGFFPLVPSRSQAAQSATITQRTLARPAAVSGTASTPSPSPTRLSPATGLAAAAPISIPARAHSLPTSACLAQPLRPTQAAARTSSATLRCSVR